MATKDKKWYYFLLERRPGSLFSHETFSHGNIILLNEGWNGVKRYAIFDSYISAFQFITKTPESERCFFEVSQPYTPRKLYFDIDSNLTRLKDAGVTPAEFESAIDKLSDIAGELCYSDVMTKDINVCVYTSNAPTTSKLSYHVVVDGVCFENFSKVGIVAKNIKARLMKSSNPAIELLGEEVDDVVYKSTQNLRISGSHKYEDHARTKRFLKIAKTITSDVKQRSERRSDEIVEFSKSLISETGNCAALLKDSPAFSIITKYEDSILETASKFYTPRSGGEGGSGGTADIDSELQKTVYDAIMNRLTELGDTETPFEIKDDGYAAGDNVIFPILRKAPSYCLTCDREHEHENPFIVAFPSIGKAIFNCRRSGDTKSKVVASFIPISDSESEASTPSDCGDALAVEGNAVDDKGGKPSREEPYYERPILASREFVINRSFF